MTKLEKMLHKLSGRPRTFKYDELRTVLLKLGYEELAKGKTSGSRVAFYNKDTDHLIRLHKPHPGNALKKYQIDLIVDELTTQGDLQ